MKVLLDECVTKKLVPYLNSHLVYTVNQMGWSGLKNGKLLTATVENGFDILLTIDKNILFEQNVKKYPISIVVFNSNTSKIEELVLFLPAFENLMPTLLKGQLYILNK